MYASGRFFIPVFDDDRAVEMHAGFEGLAAPEDGLGADK